MGTGAIVYAFKEQPIQSLQEGVRWFLYDDSVLPALDAKGLWKVPNFYMGEYKVTSDPAADPRDHARPYPAVEPVANRTIAAG